MKNLGAILYIIISMFVWAILLSLAGAGGKGYGSKKYKK